MGWGGKCSGGIDCACASHFASTLPWLIMYCRRLPLLLARALHFAFLSLLMICFCWLVLCTSPLVDFPLVSPFWSNKHLHILYCLAVSILDKNFKSSFVQAQQLLNFLSGTACSLRTLYPLAVSFTTLILPCIVEHKYSAHCYYQG